MNRKSEIINGFKVHENDTGSANVQIALLTERIRHLTEHLKTNKKDKQTVRSLIIMSARRSKLLKYLQRAKGNAVVLGVKERLSLR